VPSFFADNMVLQQQSNAAVWGMDVPGSIVKIEGSWGSTAETKTAQNGSWQVYLETPKASFEAETLTIKGSSTITLKNVLIGEVWFCSGQSNMEMPIKGFDKSPVNGSDRFLADADHPNIRLFNAPRAASLSPQNDIQGKWEMASQESVSEFSAVGYLFGKKLFDKLHIPIGIIESSWGGTQIEAWMPAASASLHATIKIPESLSKNQNEQKKPTALYNAMIYPFQDFKIKGILWYQGESNRNNPTPYKQYMHDLIGAWRAQFYQPELPFYMVQIAPYGYAEYRNGNVLDANLIREAQALAAQEIPNTGIAITSDVGKCNDIHPPEKKTIAERLANMALVEQYDFENLGYKSPEFKTLEMQGNKIKLKFDFDNATNGNQQFDTTNEIRDFTIAGKDQKFYPATVTVTDDQALSVESDKVAKPVAVRYGFVDCLEGSLFSKAGLPVSPFRTDSWKN